MDQDRGAGAAHHALWHAAKARQAELATIFAATTAGVRESRAKRLNTVRRPAFLLSGLLKCGCCGGRYGIITKERYGCFNHHRRVSCSNNRTIQRAVIEERVLAGLTEQLVSAETVAEAVRGFHEILNQENQARRSQLETDRKALAKIERAIAGIVAAVEDGLYQPTMKARVAELERQKAEIEARLNVAGPELPDIHPNVAELYGRKVRELAEALADDETSHETAATVRSLIGEVILYPGENRGEVRATLRGELLGVPAFAHGRNTPRTIVITKGVAGPRNHFCYNSLSIQI
jgi:site-specific DNA recombinase